MYHGKIYFLLFLLINTHLISAFIVVDCPVDDEALLFLQSSSSLGSSTNNVRTSYPKLTSMRRLKAATAAGQSINQSAVYVCSSPAAVAPQTFQLSADAQQLSG
jgi:hypothetical protein